jgi:hypothetical protein
MKGAVAFFLLGLVAATFAFVLSYRTQLALYNESIGTPVGPPHQGWLFATMVVALSSLVCFAVGAFSALSGFSQLGVS